MSRPCIIAGNWKMHKTISQSKKFINDLSKRLEGCTQDDLRGYIAIAPPFTAIGPCAQNAGDLIEIGAQNASDQAQGAYTGEISCEMLADAGAKFVILGHSERRSLFGESPSLIGAKVKMALGCNLRVIFCIGETEKEREEGRSSDVLVAQIDQSIGDLSSDAMSKVAIAYEPVWAIGTGKSATADLAGQTHKAIRDHLEKKWGSQIAQSLPILYGGSVKPANIENLLSQEQIDGALIGGASLDVESFYEMVKR